MKAVIERLEKIRQAIGEELAKGTSADFEKLTQLAKDDATALSELKTGGLEGTAELARQMAEMKAQLDSTAKQMAQFSKMGLQVRGGATIIPEGRDRRLQMLADGRAFASDETAMRFGAWAVQRLWKHGAGEMPRRTREIAEDVAKQWMATCKDADIDYSSGTGAELMSNEFRAELIRNVEAVGVVFPQCRRVPLNTMGTTTYPKRTAGLTSYWTDLAAAITSSGLTFGTVTLTPKKVGTLTAVPNEMLRDPMLLVAIGQLLGVEIVYAMADRIDHTVLNGDGSADHGGFTGILQSSNFGTQAATATHTTGATLTAADFDLGIGALTVAYALTNARWVLSLSMLMHGRSLRTTAGDAIFDRGGDGFPANVDGYPFTVSTRMPAKSAVTAGLKWGIFGDLRLAMYVGMIGGINIDRSEHVNFAEDMTVWRGTMHLAIAEADTNALVVSKAAAS